jgi:hypothetical protein
LIDLIYAAGGNAKLTQVAYEEGWQLGVRSDKWHYPYPLTFVDIDYKSKDPVDSFERHITRVAKERPKFATVPDLSDKEVSELDIERAVAQANRLKDYCEIVLVVPKLTGQIEMLPPELAIGYSVPTSYGGAQFPIWELTGRRVHLLGGNPHEQIKLYRYIQSMGQVLSADGNLAQKIAVERCKFWRQGGRVGGQWVDWPVVGDSQYYEAFRESCRNIRQAWLKETKEEAA